MVFTKFIRFEFPDSSIFKYDKNDTKIFNKESEYYNSISNYSKLKKIYINYTNDIYYNLRYDFSFIHNYIILPSYIFLTIIFTFNLIINETHINTFYILELISIILQLILTALKIDAVRKSKEDNYFSFLYYSGDNEEAKLIYQSFSFYREYNSNIYIVSILPLVIICIQFSTLYFFCKCNNEMPDTMCEKEDENNIIFILLNIFFELITLIIFILSPILYYPCKIQYSDYFKLDEYLYSFDINNGYPLHETNRTVIIDEYFYDDYHVLKKFLIIITKIIKEKNWN